jgi:F0F1-type ATP synthase assembly protein I
MTDEDQQDRAPGGAGKQTSGEDSGPSAATYAGLGFQLLASILIFLYAGQWLDRRFGTKGILTVAGVLFGAGAAFYSMYRRLMADQRRREGQGR